MVWRCIVWHKFTNVSEETTDPDIRVNNGGILHGVLSHNNSSKQVAGHRLELSASGVSDTSFLFSLNFDHSNVFLSLFFTMAPSLIETNYPFYSDLIFAKGMVDSGVAHRFDLFILTCLRTVFRRTTFGRIPLGEWSACRRDLYLTTHNTHNRQTSMPRVGFEPTISAGERPKT